MNSKSERRRRRLNRVVFLIGLVGLLSAPFEPALAQTDGPPTAAGVWVCWSDQQSIIHRNLSRSQLDQTAQDLALEGFHLFDIEPYRVLGQVKYTALWRKSPRQGRLFGPLGLEEFEREWQRRPPRNRRLIDLETYSHNGERFFVGIWRRGAVSQRVETALRAREFNRKYRSFEREGFRLVDFEVYLENGTRRFAAVWRFGSSRQKFVAADSWKAFHAEFHSIGEHLALSDIEMVSTGGQESYYGLWRSGLRAVSRCGAGRRDHLWVGHDAALLEARVDGIREEEKSLMLVDLEIGHAPLGLTAGAADFAAPVGSAAAAAGSPDSIIPPPPPPQEQRPGGPVHDGSSEGPPEDDGEGGG